MSTESSSLDYVAQACMDLSEALGGNDLELPESEREVFIVNHIKKVWANVSPVEDFRKNLEWVNVSEPISLTEHCSDKIVVLDFWTYCCINCYHVLPDLAHLEKMYRAESGVAVIGVHCAKFLNEKDSSNVLAAVQRYNIQHPVVNDAESVMWEALGIRCWPTLLVLGPGNKPLFVFTGEGHREELDSYIGIALKHFGSRISNSPIPITLSKHIKAKQEEFLRFPSKPGKTIFNLGNADAAALSRAAQMREVFVKMGADIRKLMARQEEEYCKDVSPNPYYRGRADEPFLAISDTGHHRVVLTDCAGVVLRIIAGPEPGFRDGKLDEAQFNSPQGLCWLSSNVIAVCDTNNHAVRAIHLDEGTVEVLTGNGKQSAHGDLGGKCLGMQSLSSPWDILLYTTPDMDMSVRPLLPPPPPGQANKENEDNANGKEKEKGNEKRRVLLIACAGSHQIWALFLDTTIWWKYKTYTEGTCVCIAGSGAEAARNGAYPHTASFAQPSGLTLRSGTSPELFIADSESSSIRRLALSSGQVSSLCGGDKNPLNLFAFGDVDDIGVEAKFQHPLGVAYSEHNKILYVADSYNHKIKKVDVATQKVTTLNCLTIESTDLTTFKEPSGLAVSIDGKYLYVADTNNHSIKIINTTKNVCQDFKVRQCEPKWVEPENLILYKNDLFVNRKCGHLVIYFNVNLDVDSRNVKFTPGAPQNWNMVVRDEKNRDVTADDFEFLNCSSKGTKLPGRVEMKLKHRTDKTHYRMYLSFQTALCDASVCFSHTFTIRSTILVRESVKMVESYKITCKVNPINRPEKKQSE